MDNGVGRIKPMVQQSFTGIAYSWVSIYSPLFDGFTKFRNQGGHEFFIRCIPQTFVSRKPSNFRLENFMWRRRKILMDCHQTLPPIVTGIIFIVSLPNISITLMAILLRPDEHSQNADCNSRDLSCLVLNDCHSFSKM